MSLQNFYVIDLYFDFPVTLKRCFILNCSDGILNFFCDFIFNVVKGNVKLEKKSASKNRCTFKRKKHYRGSLFQKENFNET